MLINNPIKVRKVIAIFFMLLFLVSTTEFGQLLKFPILVEHYVEHKTNDANLSIWGFLQIHYSESHKEIGDPVDEKLPFVSHAHIISFVGIVTPTPVIKINRLKFNTNHNKVHAFDEDAIESNYLSSIWQPPKHC